MAGWAARFFAPALLLLSLVGCVTGALAQCILAPSSADLEKTPGAQLLASLVPEAISPLFAPVRVPPAFALSIHLRRRHSGLADQSSQDRHPGDFPRSSADLWQLIGRWITRRRSVCIPTSSSRIPPTESVALSGKTSYQDWGFSFSQTYSSSSTPLAETQAPTEQESYGTAFQASRQLGSQMSAQVGRESKHSVHIRGSQQPGRSSMDRERRLERSVLVQIRRRPQRIGGL